MWASGWLVYKYDIEPSICPRVESVYAVAKLGVLRDETFKDSVFGVSKESSASEVAVKEE